MTMSLFSFLSCSLGTNEEPLLNARNEDNGGRRERRREEDQLNEKRLVFILLSIDAHTPFSMVCSFSSFSLSLRNGERVGSSD